MNYVEVAVAKQRSGARLYTYQSELPLQIGALVSVPFGKKTATAVVLGVVKKPDFITKSIAGVIPFSLPATSISLLQWMFAFYPDDYSSLTQLLLPNSFTVRPSKLPFKPKIGSNKPLPPANKQQKNALEIINGTDRAMLHGDTGTGKTRVFLEAAQNCLASGKSVLIITPEIGLTPQLITDVDQFLAAPILLTHSELTDAERRKIWEYTINEPEPSVYVGPRSALFLPYKNIGLVVMDEAHDTAYKQSQSPRYLAQHIAAKLAGVHKAKLILSTATPNITDYEQAIERKYGLARLTDLAAGEHRSHIRVIDITDRSQFTKNQYMSDEFLAGVQAALQKNEQSIVFLNRRGSARLVQCADCGWQALCPHCGVPLTYHHDLHTLRCHTCNYKDTAPSSCPDCNSVDLQFKSIGTKTLVDNIATSFPKARIMRFDTDNAAGEQLHKHIGAIKAGEVDILIGTQLLTKGIDLPNLGFVGIVNADTGLNLPDFRAEEQSFQQLHQVVGRVDRGHRIGNAVVQTRLPEHPVMQAVLARNWDDFATYELNKRKQFKYPPYCFIAQFQITKKTPALAEAAAIKTTEKLKASGFAIILLGPSPSFYEQSSAGFTWQLVAKSAKRSELVAAARILPADWRHDLDPLNLL